MNRNQRALLARIQRHVHIVESETVIAGQTVPWIKVTDPDRLLLQALEQGQDGSFELDPFWAAAWRAAVGMDHFLERIADSLRGSRVLELGGGSGRAGISAAMRGAEVFITDAATVAMLVCRYNSHHVRERVQIRCLDWRDRDSGLGKFPIIVGSDIVYDPKLFPILEPCVRRHLDHDGVAYFSEPQRHTGERFKKWIQSAGWQLREHFVDLQDGEKEIRIFECRLANRS
ncbi:class I SAM-dependent methyltransferase [Pirellulaceae bacterium SH449]